MPREFDEAIESKNWELLRILSNNKDIDKNQLLIEAIERGIINFVTILLELEANPNHEWGRPMVLAVNNNQPDILKALAKFGGNPNSDLDSDGNSLLIEAVYTERLEIVKILVETGANLKARNKSDETALTIAAYNGAIEVFNYLSGKYSSSERKAAKKLLLNVSNLEKELFYAILSDDIQSVQKIVGYGIDVNKVTDYGLPLVLASHHGHDKIIEVLISAGADPNLTCNENVDTCLIRAVSERKLTALDLLLKAGANPNQPSVFGISTPLIAAVASSIMSNSTCMIDKLLESGADINQRNIFTNTPWMAGVYFCMEANIDWKTSRVIQALVTSGASEEKFKEMSLILSAAGKNINGVKALLNKEVNVNMANFRGSTALLSAVDNLEIVRLLLDAGADVNMNTTMTPLMAAVNGIPFNGDKEVICLLIDSGANIDAKNIYGQNIMDIIKEKPNDIRKILRKFFNEIKKKNPQNNTKTTE